VGFARRKSPALAAALSFVLGPVGYLYIGWRYAIMALAVFLTFVFVLTAIHFPVPPWMGLVIMAVFAWKAFTICSVWNHLIETDDEEALVLNSFPVAAMVLSDLLVGVAMFYAGALGLYVAATLFLAGSVLRGLLVLLIGTPCLVWIARMVFGFIALGIDALFARGAENLFRR
jgi:hypothetical protein